MGEDTTAGGIRFQFTDRIKPIAQRQVDAIKKGTNPQHVIIDKGGPSGKGGQILTFFFSSTLHVSLSVIAQHNTAYQILISHHTETAKYYGSEASASAIAWQVSTRIRVASKMLSDAVDAGADPKDVDIDKAQKSYGNSRKGT